MDNKVSVIIPVYNAERTIVRCVESLLNCSYTNIEIILIDDCSQDKSLKMCEDIKKTAPHKIVVLHNNVNSGVSYTRNRGLEVMTGDYLMFVDSDDWVETDYIDTFVSELNKDLQRFIVSGYINHDEVVNQRTTRFGWEFDSVREEKPMQHVLLDLYHNRFLQQLWNKIFISSVVKENGIRFDESISIGEDFRFVLQYMKALSVKQILLINLPLYHYMRDNTSSLMSKACDDDISQPLFNIELMLSLLQGSEMDVRTIYDIEKKSIVDLYAYRVMHQHNFSLIRKIKMLHTIAGKNWIGVSFSQSFLLLKEKIKCLLK